MDDGQRRVGGAVREEVARSIRSCTSTRLCLCRRASQEFLSSWLGCRMTRMGIHGYRGVDV